LLLLLLPAALLGLAGVAVAGAMDDLCHRVPVSRVVVAP
jgi:hypothetical protein